MDNNQIFIVIVLYKKKLDESETIISLEKLVKKEVSLLVFDNSPTRQYESNNFMRNNFKVQYYHDYSNPGLSAAYNHALQLAENGYFKWLLVLDQDTVLTDKYLDEIQSLNFDKLSKQVVAIIPRVTSMLNNRAVAPVKVLAGGICRSVSLDSGEVKNQISGINSGTLLKISYLSSIGGFSKDYPLDMLDHWYFRKIFKDKKSIYLLESCIYQNLSVLSGFEENVSFNRYKQMLTAEETFIKEEGAFSQIIYKIRLIIRVFKQIKYKNKDYLKLTVNHVFK